MAPTGRTGRAPEQSRGIYTVRKITVLLVLGTLCQSAGASVIDFEALRSAGSDSPTVGASYVERGFLLTDAEFATDGLGSPFHLGGSTYLYSDVPDSTISLTHTLGYTFSISAIDLVEFITGGNVSVTFTGNRADNSTVQQTFTLDGLPGFETFTFDPRFRNLVSVRWDDSADFHAFDNIEVAVPAPATILLLGSGTLVFGARRRERQRRPPPDRRG